MNCPYCNFNFNKVLSSVSKKELQAEELIPVLCEHCADISLIEKGIIRKIDKMELEAIKESPIYKEFLEPIRKGILAYMTRKLQ
jgi:hypothetical protein